MIAVNEKCDCGSVAKVEDEDLGRAMEVIALWRTVHAECENPQPAVQVTSTSTERGTRTDPGHEQYDTFKKVPIIMAKSVPFGFVRNEENR